MPTVIFPLDEGNDLSEAPCFLIGFCKDCAFCTAYSEFNKDRFCDIFGISFDDENDPTFRDPGSFFCAQYSRRSIS